MKETSALQQSMDTLKDVYNDLRVRVGGNPLTGAEGLEDKVSKHSVILDRWLPKIDGNGKKGIFARVEAVEDWQEKKDKAENRKVEDNRDMRIAIILMVLSSLWNIFGDWISSKLGL